MEKRERGRGAEKGGGRENRMVERVEWFCSIFT